MSPVTLNLVPLIRVSARSILAASWDSIVMEENVSAVCTRAIPASPRHTVHLAEKANLPLSNSTYTKVNA